MPVLRYITHPEVTVDPRVPVPRWGLSPLGIARAEAMCAQPWARTIVRVVSSDETKAVQAAGILAGHLGIELEVRSGLGENDRSATGFVPPQRFEQLADRFFAAPEESVEGWERATDAQARITRGVADLLEGGSSGDVAVVGHGGVGTLLLCALAGWPIDRRHDQPGQGHHFAVRLPDRVVLHGWRRIDEPRVASTTPVEP